MAARFIRREDGVSLNKEHALGVLNELIARINAEELTAFPMQFTIDDSENLKGLIVVNFGKQWEGFEALHKLNQANDIDTRVVDIEDEAEVWAEDDLFEDGDISDYTNLSKFADSKMQTGEQAERIKRERARSLRKQSAIKDQQSAEAAEAKTEKKKKHKPDNETEEERKERHEKHKQKKREKEERKASGEGDSEGKKEKKKKRSKEEGDQKEGEKKKKTKKTTKDEDAAVIVAAVPETPTKAVPKPAPESVPEPTPEATPEPIPETAPVASAEVTSVEAPAEGVCIEGGDDTAESDAPGMTEVAGSVSGDDASGAFADDGDLADSEECDDDEGDDEGDGSSYYSSSFCSDSSADELEVSAKKVTINPIPEFEYYPRSTGDPPIPIDDIGSASESEGEDDIFGILRKMKNKSRRLMMRQDHLKNDLSVTRMNARSVHFAGLPVEIA